MNLTDQPAPLVLSDESISHLTTTRKWALFLSIMAFIGSAFMVLFGLFFAFITKLAPATEDVSKLPVVLMSFFYIVFGALYLFPAFFLLKFSDRLKLALHTHAELPLTQAFLFLRYIFTFFGIAAIVAIAFVVLGFALGVVLSVFAAMGTR